MAAFSAAPPAASDADMRRGLLEGAVLRLIWLNYSGGGGGQGRHRTLAPSVINVVMTSVFCFCFGTLNYLLLSGNKSRYFGKLIFLTFLRSLHYVLLLTIPFRQYALALSI